MNSESKKMRIGDLVKHKTVDYGTGIVMGIITIMTTELIAVYLSSYNTTCKFIPEDWEVINESR